MIHEKEKPNWTRKIFKNNKVWVYADSNGNPVLKNDKVLIKYQLTQDYEYWVNEKNILPVESRQSGTGEKNGKQSRSKNKKKETNKDEEKNKAESENAVFVYTDGACSGNPGQAGIGVLLRYKDKEKKISKYIGYATNNIAELEAVKEGLLALKKKNVPVRIFTDSQYVYGVLALGWKARKNNELVQSINDLKSKFKDLKFIKVEGHAGHAENETADRLAVQAINDKK